MIQANERYWLWHEFRHPRTVFQSKHAQKSSPNHRIIYTRLAKIVFNLQLTETA